MNNDFYYKVSHNKLNNSDNYQSYSLLTKILINNGIIFVSLSKPLIKKSVAKNQVAELSNLNYGNELFNQIQQLNLLPQIIESGSSDMVDYLNSINYSIYRKEFKLIGALYCVLNFDKIIKFPMNPVTIENLNYKAVIELIKVKQFEIFAYLYQLMLSHGNRYQYTDIVYEVINSKHLPSIKLLLIQPLVPHTFDYSIFMSFAALTNDLAVIKLVEQYQPTGSKLYTDLRQAVEKQNLVDIKNSINQITGVAIYMAVIDDYFFNIKKLDLVIFNLPFVTLLNILVTLLLDHKINHFKTIFDEIVRMNKYQLARQLLDQIVDETASSISEPYKKVLFKYAMLLGPD